MNSNTTTRVLLTAAGLVAGLGLGIASIASAQTTLGTTTSTSAPTTQSAPARGQMHHAPLGGDGIISSINGSTIVMSEESDEGGASYTVDASGATVSNNGSTGSISDLKVGDKVFVQGTVNGTSVTATSISLGHPNWHKESANDSDSTTEGSEPASSSGASG